MRFSLHAEAEQDISDVMDFYAAHAGYAVAKRFLDEFERAVRILLEHPDIGTPIAKGRRVFPVRVFPYSVVYRKLESGIRILIVRHQHRKPGFGSGRR
ncbi:MAG: type II toxin-antitoxin system RelE/ParE family toxin [Thiobacillaceae bacterium]